MAKTAIKHSCGHSETHLLEGNRQLRDRREQYLATRICGECYRAQIETGRIEGSRIDAVANSAEGLPALVGTEKQVRWAETIRREKLAEIDRILKMRAGTIAAILAEPEGSLYRRTEERFGMGNVERGLRMLEEWLATNRAALAANPDAKWWIDHRGDDPRTLLNWSDVQQGVETAMRQEVTA